MKKAIVTTTINKPTKAIKRFLEIAERDNWHIFVVGDKKTPHKPYKALAGTHLTYLEPQYQHDKYRELSDLIGWNCIQRRNFGFIEAYKYGAEVIATIDDDNIPLANWGKEIAIGKTITVDRLITKLPVFDPLIITGLANRDAPAIWHRGFPVQLLHETKGLDIDKTLVETLVQADLWNGDPDIDAICRIGMRPTIEFTHDQFYTGDAISPFNSQNTFLSRKLFPDYFLFPHIGRMDDIWASYVIQHKFPDCVIYGPATVFQDRNEHNLVKDLEAEMMGYNHSLEIATDKYAWKRIIPEKALLAYEAYKALF